MRSGQFWAPAHAHPGFGAIAWTPLNPLPKPLFVNMMGTRMQIQPVAPTVLRKKKATVHMDNP